MTATRGTPLPGQAASPEGPVNLLVTYAIHHGMRRDAARFVETVRTTPAGSPARWARLARRWETFAGIVRIQARGQGAGLWPVLRDRCSEAERGTFEALQSEDEALDAQVQLCAELLQRLVHAPDEDVRAALVVRMVGCRDVLERHLSRIESEAMAVLQRCLTQAEWDRIDQEHFIAPMSPRDLATMVPWTAYGLPTEVRARVFAEAGTGFRVLWWATRGRFARREARTFDGSWD